MEQYLKLLLESPIPAKEAFHDNILLFNLSIKYEIEAWENMKKKKTLDTIDTRILKLQEALNS